MFDKESIKVLVAKVPDLERPWRVFLTIAYILFLSLLCILFFLYVDRLAWYAPLVSQAIMALIVAAISYVHFEKVGDYRERYDALAYRYYFYHLMIPYLVTWYACFFHPLFVSGAPLLPAWLAIGLGILFLVLFVLASLHIERAGFHVVTYGMDVYTLFPEEATVMHGEIYAYIRHPLYFSLLCGSIGFALLRNNALALGVSLLQLIPILTAVWMEDQELLEREGEKHAAYIQDTAALIPIRQLGSFLKLLFFLGEEP
jgi:protein-S-isoprenylcysteine O-methyltransferase Ste14